MMTKKIKSSKFFTVLAVMLAVLAAAVWFPKALGVDGYYVKTGSMEPNIPQGSMVYIEAVELEEVRPGVEVLLFTNAAQNKSFTHRVMRIDYEKELVYTKGDAAEVADELPTPFEYCRGKVVFYLPLWGYIVETVDSVWGKLAIVLVYIIWFAIEIENFKSKKKAVKK